MESSNKREGTSTIRVGGLSDALFAIVLTLLVLQFEVPVLPRDQVDTELLPSLLAQWRLLFSYVLSFAVVGLYWVVHHHLFELIERHDRGLLYLNLLLLLFVSFLPFPTELFGIYASRLTWTLYAANLIAVGLLTNGIWRYALARGLVSEEVGEETARRITITGLVTPLVFLLSIALSFVHLNLAYLTPLLIIPLRRYWASGARRSLASD